MFQYHRDLETVLRHGVRSTDRTGTGIISHFGLQTRYALEDGFPLVTTKRLHLRSIVMELIWFLSGDTNIGFLKENGVSIWDEWADAAGDLGPIYGKQWRDFGGVDQITRLLDMIRETPDSRRLVVSAWNPCDVPQMALPPCHTLWQVRIHEDKLHLQLYQRSADMFLGVPFNIASYALLQAMIAHVTGYTPGTFVHSIGDAHIYENHLPQVKLQLARNPKPLPKLKICRDVASLFDFRFEDYEFDGYTPDPSIPAKVAV